MLVREGFAAADRGHCLAGISFKSQALFLAVYVARYLDLFWSFVSVYNTVAKIFFIASTAYTVYLVRYAATIRCRPRCPRSFPLFISRRLKFRATYDAEKDTLRVEYLLIPCALLALVFNYHFEPSEVRAVQRAMP